MTRFIPVREPADGLPDRVYVEVGDVLWVTATGARVRSGTAVEVLGILQEAVLGTDGRALSPMGTPNTVLLRAQRSGQTEIDLVTGDPWHSPQTRTVTVIVEP
jgi:hypothetical protein